MLPGLARMTVRSWPEPSQPGRSLRLVAAPSLTPGLALLDAPDIDSFVEANRELAVQLLAAADLWLFVTTAARYADAVPWDLLRVARERATALAVVLDRVPPEALGEVEAHLRQLLDREGLADAPLLVVPEARWQDGSLPDAAVAPVRDWIGALAADAGARAEVIRATLTGAVNSLQLRGAALASALDAQERAARELGQAVDAAYDQARATVGHELSGGTLLRGEVLARWQELVGTGELMRTLESRIGWVRDRVAAAVLGRPSAAAPVELALESSLEGLLRDAAERAAGHRGRRVGPPAGRPGAAGRQPARAGPGRLRTSAAGPSRRSGPGRARCWSWSGPRARDRRQLAKLASYGVNGAGSVLIVALFAQTGGLTGGEIAIAGGTAALSQKVLEAIFGDQAVRSLAAQARQALLAHVDALLAAEARAVRPVAGRGRPAGRVRPAGSGPPCRPSTPPAPRRPDREPAAPGAGRPARRAGPGGAAGRRPVRPGAAGPGPGAAGPGRGAPPAVSGQHRGGAGRRHRQRQVQPVQRARRRATGSHRGAPAHHQPVPGGPLAGHRRCGRGRRDRAAGLAGDP